MKEVGRQISLLGKRIYLFAKCLAILIPLLFAAWLGMHMLFPPHRLNWPKALDQALNSSIVFLITTYGERHVRDWFKKAPTWLQVPIRLPRRRPR